MTFFFGEVTIKLVGSSRIVYIETRDGSKISSAWFGFSESSPQKIVFFSNLELVFVFLRRSSGCGSFIQVKMVVDWVNGVTVWVYPYIRNSK